MKDYLITLKDSISYRIYQIKQRIIKYFLFKLLNKIEVWDLDNTLAEILLPLLVRYKKTEYSRFTVDDVDVPNKEIHTYGKEHGTYDWDKDEFKVDEKLTLKYDYVIDEIIWTMIMLATGKYETHNYSYSELIDIHTPITEGAYKGGTILEFDTSNYYFDEESYNKDQVRIKNGLRLFG